MSKKTESERGRNPDDQHKLKSLRSLVILCATKENVLLLSFFSFFSGDSVHTVNTISVYRICRYDAD